MKVLRPFGVLLLSFSLLFRPGEVGLTKSWSNYYMSLVPIIALVTSTSTTTENPEGSGVLSDEDGSGDGEDESLPETATVFDINLNISRGLAELLMEKPAGREKRDSFVRVGRQRRKKKKHKLKRKGHHKKKGHKKGHHKKGHHKKGHHKKGHHKGHHKKHVSIPHILHHAGHGWQNKYPSYILYTTTESPETTTAPSGQVIPPTNPPQKGQWVWVQQKKGNHNYYYHHKHLKHHKDHHHGHHGESGERICESKKALKKKAKKQKKYLKKRIKALKNSLKHQKKYGWNHHSSHHNHHGKKGGGGHHSTDYEYSEVEHSEEYEDDVDRMEEIPDKKEKGVSGGKRKGMKSPEETETTQESDESGDSGLDEETSREAKNPGKGKEKEPPGKPKGRPIPQKKPKIDDSEVLNRHMAVSFDGHERPYHQVPDFARGSYQEIPRGNSRPGLLSNFFRHPPAHHLQFDPSKLTSDSADNNYSMEVFSKEAINTAQHTPGGHPHIWPWYFFYPSNPRYLKK